MENNEFLIRELIDLIKKCKRIPSRHICGNPQSNRCTILKEILKEIHMVAQELKVFSDDRFDKEIQKDFFEQYFRKS